MGAQTIQTPQTINESYDKIKITAITFALPINPDEQQRVSVQINAVYCKEVGGILVESEDPEHKIVVDSNIPGVEAVLNTFIDAAYTLVVAQTGDVIV